MREKRQKRRPTAVGANIFAGGFTLGVSQHFEVLAHLEHDDYGVEVARANFPGLRVFTSLDAWPETANKRIDFVYANPPCAIWSLAGNRLDRGDWTKDPRLQRVRDIFGLVERYRPRVWAWESVCPAYEKGRPFVDELIARAAALGYAASCVLIDAQYLRAPQTRKRFFLVLHRVAIDWAAARPDYALPPVTVGDALKGVKPNQFQSRIADTPIGKQMRKLIAGTPPGGRLAGTFDQVIKNPVRGPNGKTSGKPSFLAYRIDPTKVAGVVFGDKTFHHLEARHLALNELGAIHGFPPTWDWVGEHHRLDVQRGVLPPVGEWLARAVAAAIAADRKIRAPITTLVDLRRPPGLIQAGLDLGIGKTESARRTRSVEAHAATAPRAGQKGLPPPSAEGEARELPAKQARARRDVERFNREAPRDAPAKVRRTAAAVVDYAAVSIPAALGKVAPSASTSGEVIREALRSGKFTDEAIAAAIRQRFTGRKTTVADVAWNRNQLRKTGVTVPDRIREGG